MNFFTELRRRNVIRVGALYGVAGWLLLQVADVLFGVLGLPDWSLRLVFGLLLLGLPLVLIFSWAFEMTPEGIKRERDVIRDDSITTHTGRKIDRLIIAGLVLVVALLVADRLLLAPAARTTPPAAESAAVEPAIETPAAAVPTGASQKQSIAVLPFVNMSGDADNEYFSDGLTEELLNLLAQVDRLRVSSRTSSFAFKGKDTALPSVAQQLKVANILEGSVRKSGVNVRITAQLIDVETDSHLWSETYDRKLDDIFAIQDEIAQAVVEALKVHLLEPGQFVVEQRPATNTDAYMTYLRGRYTYQSGRDTRQDDLVRRAVAQYEAALEIDPNYALAYAGLADAYGWLAIQGEYSMQEGYERSRELALKALAIDPDLVEALLALADIQLEYDWDMQAAERSYRRALEIRPNDAEGLRTYGYFLVTDGRFDEAIDYYERALEVDPLQVRAYYGLAFTLLLAGRADEVDAVTELLAEHQGPEFMQRWNRNVGILKLRYAGRYEEMVELLPAEPDNFGDLVDAAVAHYHLGHSEQAEGYLDQLLELADAGEGKYVNAAAALAQMDQPDRAMAYLEKSVEAREVNNAFIRIDPDFEPLYNDPRFLALLERMGLEPPPTVRR